MRSTVTEIYRYLLYITEKEVKKSIRCINIGKPTGHDQIAQEILKGMEPEGVKGLTRIYNMAQKEEVAPENWKMGIIHAIHQKGHIKKCGNYRGITKGITLLDVVAKVAIYKFTIKQIENTDREMEINREINLTLLDLDSADYGDGRDAVRNT